MTTATAPRVSLTEIGQIAIRVLDVDRAVGFYRDVLGAPFLFQFPGLAFFQLGGVRLMLSKPEGPDFDHPASTIYYKVTDIDGAYAALKAKGAEFVDAPHLIAKMPDHDLWMAFLKDSEGNVLGLMEEKRPPAPPAS
ncbi:MAG TPA: VOC family protein [Chloroflexota bacterium]|nr:VOC family protein [Chloroflexota bacterium]